MDKTTIQIEGWKEIAQRMQAYPQKLDAAAKKTMEASLLTLQENVPPYPEAPLGVNTSGRQGTLGRSLGSSMSGGSAGRAEIFEIKQMGQGLEGGFGTRLNYAPRVIGEGTQERPWSGYWWHIGKIRDASIEKINGLWDDLTKALAAWLDGKG